MSENNSLTSWQRWLRHPQKLSFRRALFQIHLWSGIALGLYIFFISITGSILVYRNELYVIFTPEPIISSSTKPVLDESQLRANAIRQNPDFRVTLFYRAGNRDQAVIIWLQSDSKTIKRLFDSRTGEDVGSANETGVTMVTKLIQVHDNFLAGATGRKVNGLAASAVILVLLTGLVIWWPGAARWRRSLVIHRGMGWKRLTWDIHSMMGFWTFVFMMTFTLSGIYLCFPESFHAFADRIQPVTDENAGRRLIDSVLYWLAFLHFGRINGIGIPCSGPGLCDQSVKALWAIFGLAPAAMFVTGTIMWWNRVLRRWWHKAFIKH
jgi:uncharacterized iron-regulated membrane protein